MVLIFSSKANDSRHIHREVQTAFEQDLTVIPFRVENTQPTGTMEYYLGSVHWLDALTAPVESHMMAVVDRVKALLPAAKAEPIAEVAPPIPHAIPPVVTHSELPQSRPEEVRRSSPKEIPRNDDIPRPISPIPAGGAALLQWKMILLFMGAILGVNVIAILALRIIGHSLGGDIDFLIGDIGAAVLQIGLFALAGSKTEHRKWVHLFVLAILAGALNAFVIIILDPYVRSHGSLRLVFIGMFLSMGTGGGLSYLFPKRKSPPELSVPTSNLPLRPVAPLSFTTGPAAGIAPPSPSSSSSRKKIIQRVFMGVVGLVAIGFGASQIASGLHLFSKKESRWRKEELGDRVVLSKYDCSLRVPKLWTRKDVEEGATIFSAPPDSSRYPMNIIVNSEAFAGSLKEYAQATVKSVRAMDPAVEIGEIKDFETEAGATGQWVRFHRVVQDKKVLHDLHVYDGPRGNKIVVTMTTTWSGFSEIEDCPWTLALTGDKR